jgi:hypothetical protein
MAYATRHSVTITTIADGSATGYLPASAITGQIELLVYTKDDFADGVDFTITTETGGETVWTDVNINASETVAPRRVINGTDGAAQAVTVAPEKVWLVNERIKIVIASGGNVTSGTFTAIVS